MNYNALQKTELYILDSIKKICKDFDIPFFLVGGTLLGAVRHQGMIPWDDDIDIGMQRSDFEKFASIVPGQFKKYHLFLQSDQSDSNYPLGFMKAIFTPSDLVEPGHSGSAAVNGVFVDIFPFDGLSENAITRKVTMSAFHALNMAVEIKQHFFNDPSTRQRIITWPLRQLPVSLLKHVRHHLILTGGQQSRYVTNWYSQYGSDHECIARIDLAPNNLCELRFDEKYYPVPSHYKEVLSRQYGNYMQLPSLSEQQPKHTTHYTIYQEPF